MDPDELADRIHHTVVGRRWALVRRMDNRLLAAPGHLLLRLGERVMKKALYDNFPGIHEFVVSEFG